MSESIPPASDELRDPMEVILKDMRTRPDDAATLAEFMDVSVLVEIFRECGYNAREKVRTLIGIFKDGTPSQKMQAMDRLDAIWENALVRRGMLMGKGTAPPAALPTTPMGMAQPIRSITATQTTTSVQATMDAVAGEITDRPPQPLQEMSHDNPQEQSEEDDAYYTDDRGEDANIFRPANADHGQRTEIG